MRLMAGVPSGQRHSASFGRRRCRAVHAKLTQTPRSMTPMRSAMVMASNLIICVT